MSAGLFNMLYSGATHAREQGKINAARIRTASQNNLKASNASLQQWEQSLRNQKALKYAGDQITNVNENLARSMDQATYGRAMSRLQAAEEVGANLASAAAAGVGGSTVDQFASTLSLSQAMQEEQGDRAVSAQNYAMNVAKQDILGSTVDGLGNQIFQANLDFTTFMDHKKMSTSRQLFTTLAAGVATYFGGPQAGAAVFDFSDSGYRAGNGDLDGAAVMMERSLTQGLSAFSSYTQRGNSAWGADLLSGYKRNAAAGANLQIGGPDTSTLGAFLRTPYSQRRGR